MAHTERSTDPSPGPAAPDADAASGSSVEKTPAAASGLSAEERRALPSFGALHAFEAVGTYGGVRRAAAALSRDHASVSRYLRALEEWAGVPLTDRHGGQLTPQGARFHRRISVAMKEIARASNELTHRSDERRLRLWCVPGLAAQWLTPRLGTFSATHPGIEIELQPTLAMPDFTWHEADAVIRYVPANASGAVPGPDLIAVEIARPPILAVASPVFASSTGRHIRQPADLVESPLLHEASFDQWLRWLVAQGVNVLKPLSGPRLWHAHLTIAAARRGQGIALSNAFLVGDDLRTGALQEIGGGRGVTLGSYQLVGRRDRWSTAPILGFRRWLERTVAASGLPRAS